MKDVTDVTKFDSLFVESLVLLIITKIGSRIQGDGFNSAPYLEELQRVSMEAKRVDAQDASPAQWGINTFTNARRNSSGVLIPSGNPFEEY